LDLTCVADTCNEIPSDCSAGSSSFYIGDCGTWGTCECNGMAPMCTFPEDFEDCGTSYMPNLVNCLDECQADNGKSSDICLYEDCAAETAAFYCCLKDAPMFKNYVKSVAYCESGARQMCREVSCCNSIGCSEEEYERGTCQGIAATDETIASDASREVFGWALVFAAIQLFLTWCN